MADTKKVQLIRPFVVGARDTARPGYTATKALSAVTQKLDPYKIDTIGFVGAIYIYTVVTGSNAGGAAVALQEDAPESIYESITIYDSGSKPLGGTMTGPDWRHFIMHAGFTGAADEHANVGTTYGALSTGAGATAGSGHFAMRIPIGINKRNGLGYQVNKNAGSTLRLEWSLAPLVSTYSTAPSAGATVEITAVVEGFLDAAPADSQGNPVYDKPPGGDTTQYISKHTYAINAGAFKQRLDSIDGPLRMLLMIFRTTAAGTRAAGEAAWPPLATLRYENLDPWLWPDWFWRNKISEWYGYQAAAGAANGRLNGVYPMPFFDDQGLTVGLENGFKYLPVSSQVAMSIDGTWGGAGTLDVIVNRIYPGNADALNLTGGR